MIYLIFSQIVMLLMNLAILINSKLSLDFYKLYYMSIPVVVYCIFTCLFYIRQLRKALHKRESSHLPGELIPVVALLIINIVYFVIEIFIDKPDNPFWFYISTSVVQLVNILYIFAYQKDLDERYMNSKKQLFNSFISYLYVIMSVLTLYACVFINIYATVIAILATSFVLALSLTITYVARRNHSKR